MKERIRITAETNKTEKRKAIENSVEQKTAS